MARQANRIGDVFWKLELSKSLADEDVAVMASAYAMADMCLTSNSPLLCFQSQHPRKVARALRVELSQRGETVAGLWIDRLAAHIRFTSATVLAWLVWTWIVLAYLPWQVRPPRDSRIMLAVHGECSNRTRSLLPPHFSAQRDIAYLIVGRPREKLRSLRAKLGLDAVDGDSRVLRPASRLAALRSMPDSCNQIAKGWWLMADVPVLPSCKDLSGMVYRMIQGQCYRHFWAESGLRPRVVVYAHTGTADTTALEISQQSLGARTIHLVHGISPGWNFTGLSDLAAFQCGHDAAWHRSLPAYGSTTWLQAKPPAANTAGSGWVLLSNYVHPANGLPPSIALSRELALIGMVSEAARLAGVEPECVTWKPHPAFDQADRATRRTVLNSVKQAGFNTWPPGSSIADIARFRLVLTTPSTIALDALRLGKVPIIVHSAPLQPDTVIGALPAKAGNAWELARLVGQLSRDELWRDMFVLSWRRAKPGAPFSMATIRSLIDDGVPKSGELPMAS